MNPKAPSVIRFPIAWATDELGGNLIEIKPNWFKKLRGPGVYMIAGHSEMLYIGMSSNLLSRISSPKHEAVIKSLEHMISKIQIVPARSVAHARDLESTLIHHFQPKYNIVGKITEFQKKFEQLQNQLP